MSIVIHNVGAQGTFYVDDVNDTLSATTHSLPSGLQAQGSELVNLSVEIPGLAPGSYFFGAIVDDLDAVPESNEANNSLLSSTGQSPLGTFVVSSPGGSSPTIVSLTPVNSNGATTTFQGTFTDPDGVSGLSAARILVNATQTGSNGCYARYDAVSDSFALRDDAGTSWLPLPAGETVDNAQCILRASGSAAAVSGPNLVVDWDIAFKYPFSNNTQKTVYLEAVDQSANTADSLAGSWTGPLPNLQLSGLTTPAAVTQGQPFNVQVTIDNLAGPVIPGPVEVGFYITTGSQPAANPANRVVVCSVHSAGGLPAGAAACSGDATASTVGTGLTFRALVDDNLAVPESNDNDNALSSSIDVNAPAPGANSDLDVTFVTVSPTQAGQGTPANYHVSFRNRGTESTGAGFDIGVYVSSDSVITAADQQVAGCTWSGGMLPGAVSSCSGPFPTSGIALGSYFFGAIVDRNDVIAESEESNNTRLADNTSTFTVTQGSGGPAPDVFPTFTTYPAQAEAGQQISLTVAVVNQGSDIAFAPFTVQLYLSASAVPTFDEDIWFGPCDNWNPNIALHFIPNTPFTTSCTKSVTLPTNLAAGDYYLFGRLDSYPNIAADSDHDNHISIRSIDISSATPENAVPATDSLTPSSGTGPGATFTATYSDGNGAADIQFTYLSVNTNTGWAGSCGLRYNPAANVLQILKDDGSWWQPTGITPGSGTLSNDKCSVDGTGVTVTSNANSITVTAPVAFEPSFAGTKNVYLDVVDFANTNPGFQLLGNWTVL